MLRILRRMAGVCAALALVSANAATVTYSFTNPLSPTEINQTGSLSLFDSNLGTLTGASLTVTGNLESVATLAHSDARNQRLRLIFSSDVGLSSSLGAVHQLFNHSSDLSIATDTGLQTVAPGATYVSPLLTDQKILTANLNAALAALSAPGGGNFNVNCASLSGVSLSGGGGNVRYTQSTRAGCDATITYTYDPAPPIDLTIAKTVTSSGPYIVGSNVTYSLLARNLGPGVAQPAIVVKDLLPTGLTYVSATGTNWTCAAAGPTITCTRTAAGTLAANASADAITVVAKVDAGVAIGTSLVNYAQVAPAGNETVPESNPLGTVNGGYEDGNPASGSNNDDSKAIVVTVATAVPTLNEWMLLLLSAMLGLLAMRQAQVRRHMK